MVTMPLLGKAGISSDQGLGPDEMEPVINRLMALGKVPSCTSTNGTSPRSPLDLDDGA
jgi:hypothetical protein